MADVSLRVEHLEEWTAEHKAEAGEIKVRLADIAPKVERLDGWAEDHKSETGEIHDLLDLYSKNIDRLIKWALEGNGDSAETRLRVTEKEMEEVKRCVERAMAPENVERIAEAAATAIVKKAREKDRTWVAKARAIAAVLTPIGIIFGGIAAIVVAILSR